MAAAELGQAVDFELDIVFAVLFRRGQLDVLHFPLFELVLVARILNLLESSLDSDGFRLSLRPFENALILQSSFGRLPGLSCLTHVIGLHTHVAHSRLRKGILRLFDQPSMIIVRT